MNRIEDDDVAKRILILGAIVVAAVLICVVILAVP
jgi:hypothetical protein